MGISLYSEATQAQYYELLVAYDTVKKHFFYTHGRNLLQLCVHLEKWNLSTY